MSDATAPLGEEARPIIDAEPAQPLQAEAVPARADGPGGGYSKRFAVVYGVLAAIAVLGVVAFAVLLTRPDPAPTPKWSVWQPTGSETSEVRQIADQVARKYKGTNGKQLVAALPSEPKVAGQTGDVPVSVIAIRPDTSKGKKEASDIDIVQGSSSYQYILCGLGASCSIKGGTASTARHALLRREALELALYTFKYVDGIDSISVFLPPRPDGQAAATSVFLKRSDLKEQLSHPLADTIGAKTPTVGKMTKKELALVNKLTDPRLYSYEYQQAQDGSAVLIYDPVVLGT